MAFYDPVLEISWQDFFMQSGQSGHKPIEIQGGGQIGPPVNGWSFKDFCSHVLKPPVMGLAVISSGASS